MKGFGKFVTFVGVAGAAVAGLWYFCDVNKKKCPEGKACEPSADGNTGERSYVTLDSGVREDVKEAAEDIKEEAEEIKEEALKNKDSLKKAVKGAARDIISKAEDAAKGVGLVKDDKQASDFEFKDLDEESSKIEIE